MTEIIPYLFYRDVPAALDWLARVFGFEEVLRHPTAKGMHAQMLLDGRMIMMGQSANEQFAPPQPGRPVNAGVFIYVADVSQHHARAQQAGAAMEHPLADHGYGLTYTARDLEGQVWFFTQKP